MGLVAVTAAFRDVLARVTGIGTVAAGVPPMLADDRTAIVYAVPGDAVAMANAGRAGRPVYRAEDQIVIEWHVKIAKDDVTRGDEAALPVLDAVRGAVWAQPKDGMFAGTVTLLTNVATEHYGDMGYGSDNTFGFRLLVSVTIAAEAA